MSARCARLKLSSRLDQLLGSRPPGTRNPEHLNENLGALYLELTEADLRDLETSFAKIKIHGGWMSEKFEQDVDRSV